MSSAGVLRLCSIEMLSVFTSRYWVTCAKLLIVPVVNCNYPSASSPYSCQLLSAANKLVVQFLMARRRMLPSHSPAIQETPVGPTCDLDSSVKKEENEVGRDW